MAAAITKLSGPAAIPGVGHMAVYSVLLDSSFAAGGEIVDISGDFSTVIQATAGASDDNDDHGYKFAVTIPATGTAVSATNVLISAHQSGTATAVLDEANTVDLSTVGELRVTVIGKIAVPTSWA